MKTKRKNKSIILILVILFQSALILGSLLISAKAVEYIPTGPDPNNNWHWGVDVGDLIMFENEMIVTYNDTGEIIAKYRNIEILNIT